MRCFTGLLCCLCFLSACATSEQAPDPAPSQGTDTEALDTAESDSSVMETVEAEEVDAPAPTEVISADAADTRAAVGDGSVGSACTLDSQCESGALCLDWPGGYCTWLNCPTVEQCPEDAACIMLGSGATVCLEACSTHADCRDGYGCKPFVDANDELRSVCVGLADEPMPAGGLCEEHTDCADSLACLTFVPDGYCALLGCDESSCPADTHCVTYNGQPTCLRECATTEDCLVGGAEERVCGPLLDVEQSVANVCIPAIQGVAVGSECTQDIQCETNECRIVAEGKCVSSSKGCFEDMDCPGGGVCELAPAYVKGVCTQACGAGLTCPGNALCVQSASEVAWCEVPCSGATDVTTCDADVGESCVYGDPVANTTGSGTYACVQLKAGAAGGECTAHMDCLGEACLGEPGLCAPSCDLQSGCPFPAVCTSYENQYRCMKRCFSVQDCPAGWSCKTTPRSSSKICLP